MGITTSQENVYHLKQCRVGSLGQLVNQTINGSTTPWIWGMNQFGTDGKALPLDHQIFPTYFIYDGNGQFKREIQQSDLETFIQLDGSSRREAP